MPKKILLADDSITIQKVVELTFSDGDYQVTAVNNGAKAIQSSPKCRPDIILSDIIMPEKNGYEVCSTSITPRLQLIPVILLTGLRAFDPDRAEKAGWRRRRDQAFESQSLIQKAKSCCGRGQLLAAFRSNASPVPQLRGARRTCRLGGGQKTRDDRTPFSAPPQEKESPFAPLAL